MPVGECMWCETTVKHDTAICPECGLQNPACCPAAAEGRSRAAVRRGKGIILALVAVPLMLSTAYAAHVKGFPLVASVTSGAATIGGAGLLPLPHPNYTDPLERSVWIDGVKAVQQALGRPGYANFDGSFVHVAAGHVVTLCGQVADTSGYDSENGGQRFISVFGQAQATTLEGSDTSFGVLWNRVCVSDANAA